MIRSSLGIRCLFLGALAAGIAWSATVSAQALPGEGKSVRPVRASWDTFWFGGVILQIGLERLGYKILEPQTLTSVAIYQALSQGDGHFTADTVMPNAEQFLEKTKDTVVNFGPIMNPGSIQGYLIDKATSEKHGIRFVTDLLEPKNARLFADDGSSLARMVGPSAGWSSENTALHHFKKLALDKTVKLVQGEYNVLVADTVARHKAGKPVLLYGWYPNTATVQLPPGKDLVWLQMKETDLPNMAPGTDTTLRGVTGCSGNADPCNTGWSATIYHISANKKWAAENPAAAKFFSLIKMELNDRVEQNLKMQAGEKRDEHLRRHAEDWIARNKTRFDAWIDEAKKPGT